MNIPLDEVIYFDAITTHPSTGAATDADSTPTFAVYEEATDTDIGVGGNLTKRTSLTGNYRGTFTLSAANGFEVGKWYSVIGSATVNSIAGKAVLKNFRVVAAEAIAGKPKADVDAFGGTAGTFASGRPEVNTTHISGTAWASTTLFTLASHDPGATIGTSTLTQTQVTGGAYSIQSASCVLGDARIANLDTTVSSRGTSTLTQTQVTGGAYSVQSASCVLGDARIANLDAAVSTRSTLTQTQVTGGAYTIQSSSCVLGDARVANLDAAVTTRMATFTLPTNFSTFSIDSDGAAKSNVTKFGNSDVNTSTPVDGNGYPYVNTLLFGATSSTIVDDIAARQYVNYGSAASATSSTVVGPSGFSTVNDAYKNCWIWIVSGTGADQAPRLCTGYIGSTRTFAITPNWTTTPATNDKILILPAGIVGGVYGLDTLLSTTGVALTAAERNAIADAHIGRNIAGGSSTGRLVKDVYARLRNRSAVSGGTFTVYSTDDTTSLWTATLTTDAAAEPVVDMDPT